MKNEELDKIIAIEKQKAEETQRQQDEAKKKRRQQEKEEFNRQYLHIAAMVTEVRVEKDIEKQRRRTREVLDAIIDAFKNSYNEAHQKEMSQKRENMMLDNLMHSLPDLSNEQLKYMNKKYSSQAEKIIKGKIERREDLTIEEVKTLELHRKIEKEIQKRQQIEQQNSQNQSEEMENNKKKGKTGR